MAGRINPEEVTSATVEKALPYTNLDLLKSPPSDLRKEIEERLSTASLIRDLRIDGDGQLSLTLTGYLNAVRYPDEQLDLPVAGWYLAIDYGTATITTPFVFQVHPSNEMVTRQETSGFRGFY